MKKRCIAILLSVCLCAGAILLGLPAYAASGITVSGRTVEVIPGETLDYSIEMSGNTGLSSFAIRLAYDADVLTLVEQNEDGDNPYCVKGNFSNKGNLLSAEKNNGTCTVIWYYTSDDTSDVTGDGSLFSVRFRVAEDAPAGTYPVTISYDAANTLRGDEERVTLNCSSGGVMVREFVPTILGSNITAVRGTEFLYPVTIQDNPGIEGFHIYLFYNSAVMTPVMVGNEPDLKPDIEPLGAFTAGIMHGSRSSGVCQILWSHTSVVETSGAAFQVRFKVNENAVGGTYPITVGYIPDGTLCEEQPVSFQTKNGAVIVPYNSSDKDYLSILARHVAGIETMSKAQQSFADVDGNGKINALDLTAFARFVRTGSSVIPPVITG